MEEWRNITEFEGLFMVSNSGDVRSTDRYLLDNGTQIFHKGKMLKPFRKDNGYIQYHLTYNGKTYNRYAHRLVAQSFIENPYNLSDVNHKDGNRENNKVENLEWLSHKDNMKQTKVYIGNRVCACGKPKYKYSKKCRECRKKEQRLSRRKIDMHSVVMTLKANNGNFEMTGREFGVSGNAIRKWLRGNELPYRSCDYKTT